MGSVPPPLAAGGSQTGSQQPGLPWQGAASRHQPSLWERKTRPGQPHTSASPHQAAPGGGGARANADFVPPVGNPSSSTGLHPSPPGGEGRRLPSSPPSRTKQFPKHTHSSRCLINDSL